jgi:LytS/YehU family sensor histidine kinase
MTHGASNIVPLRQELHFIEAYLDLEKTRLGDRLEVRWNVNREALPALVPQMILQPLVENAIKHGIACCRRPGWLAIEGGMEGANVHLTVRNSTGSQSPLEGVGCGLQNTRSRLRFLYGDQGHFTFEVMPTGEAVAALVIPSLAAAEPIDDTAAAERVMEGEY